jgi:hypothetical protein
MKLQIKNKYEKWRCTYFISSESHNTIFYKTKKEVCKVLDMMYFRCLDFSNKKNV